MCIRFFVPFRLVINDGDNINNNDNDNSKNNNNNLFDLEAFL